MYKFSELQYSSSYATLYMSMSADITSFYLCRAVYFVQAHCIYAVLDDTMIP